MKYFSIDTMPMDTAFAFTKQEPSGFEDSVSKLMEGEKVVPEDGYPSDAHVRMADDFGRQLGGIIGNTWSLLIVHRAMKEALEQLHAHPVQYLPVAIRNHKNRLASSDYFVVNPLGALDCLDLEESEIEYHDGDVVGLEKVVLSEPKLSGAPALFRVKESPGTYVVSEDVIRAWIRLDPRPKNVYAEELAVTSGKAPAKRKTTKPGP